MSSSVIFWIPRSVDAPRKMVFCVAFWEEKLTVLVQETGRRQEGLGQLNCLLLPYAFPRWLGLEEIDPWGKMPQDSQENPDQRKYLLVYLSICLYIKCVYLTCNKYFP